MKKFKFSAQKLVKINGIAKRSHNNASGEKIITILTIILIARNYVKAWEIIVMNINSVFVMMGQLVRLQNFIYFDLIFNF